MSNCDLICNYSYIPCNPIILSCGTCSISESDNHSN